MKITPIQLAKRVEKWGKLLSPLGIAHFDIKCVTVADEMDSETAVASAQVSTQYDRVWFTFKSSFIEDATEEDLDKTIIHEWLHVAMRDLDRTLEAVEPWMPSATYEQWDCLTNYEREGLVDRLSVALYHAHTGTPARFHP